VAGQRAIAIYQTLAPEFSKELRPANGLKETEQEVALTFLAAGQPAEAIRYFDQARRTLESIVAHPNLLPSMVVQTQLSLTDVDHKLRTVSNSDPARYADLRKVVASQVFEVLKKVSLIQPLPRDSRCQYAGACLHAALYREQDTGQPDLVLLRQSEQLWAEIQRKEPANREARRYLVIVRQQLVEALAARGFGDEEAHWRRDSLSTARGDFDLLYEIALGYARSALEVGGLSHQHASRGAEAQRRRFLRYAVSMVQEAIADGFKNAAQLRNEPLLAPIRALPEFQVVVRDLEFPVDPFAWP
jgi:hypothetical protein